MLFRSVLAESIPDRVKALADIRIGNFLEVTDNQLFEGIIANPPYIRHRELINHMELRTELSISSGCEIPKSANLYVDFLVKSLSHLKVGGRAAFLIPAEWMSANFSNGLKEYLLKNNLIHSLVTFSNCSNIFEKATTTASLVLIEKSMTPVEEIRSFYLQKIDATNAPASLRMLERKAAVRMIRPSALRAASKWEPILRGDQTALPKGWVRLGELTSTKRGIATGANEFFLISEGKRSVVGIEERHVLPCIGRSNDVRGLLFSLNDFNKLKQRDAKIWLLNFGSKLSPCESAYIKQGEAEGFHERYLTRCRQPWFSMEQRAPAPIWAGVFGRGDLRFVYNEANIRSLTNFHCIYTQVKSRDFDKALVAMLNSRQVRDLMVSHQRGYGGGLMKFEPKDLTSIPVPDIRLLPLSVIEELAEYLKFMHKRQMAETDLPENRISEIISMISDVQTSEDYFRLI